MKSVTPVTMSLPENLEDIYLTDVSTSNRFAGLLDDFDHSDEAHVPDFLSIERVEGRMQQRFELMCRNRQEAITLHRAHGHPNNRTLLLNLEAKGIPRKHLKRYILAVSCDACQADIGKRDNKTSTVTLSKRKAMAQQKKTVHVSFILNNGKLSPHRATALVALEMIDPKKGILSTVLLKKMCGKTTNCSRTPLISKWYLGGPLTNSRMTK